MENHVNGTVIHTLADETDVLSSVSTDHIMEIWTTKYNCC